MRLRYIDDALRNIEFKSLFNINGKYVIEEISLLDQSNGIDYQEIRGVLFDRFGFEPTGGGRSAEEILESYGLAPKITLRKTRRVFRDNDDQVEVNIDIIEGIPPHIEVELIGDDRDRYKIILDIFKESGLAEPTGNKGYLEMITDNNVQIRKSEEFNGLFQANPAWNVLRSEGEIISNLSEME